MFAMGCLHNFVNGWSGLQNRRVLLFWKFRRIVRNTENRSDCLSE